MTLSLVGENAFLAAARGDQQDIFGSEPPVVAAYGMGVDSTAMIIEMISRGERIDQVLTADTGSEKPQTYAYLRLFMEWLRCKNIPFEMVRYKPKNYKNFPKYNSLAENCITNGTLPSISFGFSSCSQKWKVAPQDKWTDQWEPARRVWAAGGKVIKLIGYDCSPADNKRYADREGYESDKYLYRYPLREWGWNREACIARIQAEGLPVPMKSACFMCGATKPAELFDFDPAQLRLIVLMEARAAPRLTTVEGLWRKAVKGARGGTPRPGSMTEFIRAEGLLPEAEINAIINNAPDALASWLESISKSPLEQRPAMEEWLGFFEHSKGLNLDASGAPHLYPDVKAA